MKLHYRLDVEDLEACQAHVAAQYRSRKGMRWRHLAWTLPPSVLLGMGFELATAHGAPASNYGQQWFSLVIGALVFVSFLASLWWRRGGGLKAWLNKFAGDYELTLSPGGAWFRTVEQCGFYAWRRVRALEETERHWLLYLRPNLAIPVPKASLPAEFAAEVRRLWAEWPEHGGLALPDQVREPGIGERWRRALGDNLLAGLRLAYWRPVSPGDFREGTRPLAWLLMLVFVSHLVVDYVQSMPRPVFDISGVSSFLAGVLLFLVGGVAVAGMVARRDTVPRLYAMLQAGFLAIQIPYLLAYYAIAAFENDYTAWLIWGLFLVNLGLLLLVAFRAVRLLYHQPWPSALLLASVFAFFGLALPLESLSRQPLFYQDYSSEEPADKQPKIDAEETIYRQPQLMEQALSRLQPQRPGKTDLYFIGFAGQADEKVFANEVRFARDLLERRFGADGRSLALVNSKASVADTPLANAHNLETALRGLGERMDKEEDVLFLFLTSHGAKDHTLSVSFWPIGLNDLKAEKLREMLDRSGIRNRVIVVSACYSGGFLDVLKDDNTLVLTASRRDHVSYGCGDATEYTYFGESYFVKSLAHENSFVGAFDKARGLIEAREKREGMDASGPQIYIGKNIQGKLDELEVN